MGARILNEKTAWTARYLEAILIEYENGSGNVLQWEAFRRLRCDGIVAVVPFTAEGETVIVKQFRPPVGKYVLEFPAGLNDRGEPLDEVARRELLEETGYMAPTLREIAVGPLSAGASTEVLTVYLATNVVKAATQNLDLAEEIEIITLPVEGFYDSLNSLTGKDTYTDLKVYGLFELAKKHL
jgi:ADP-ribose pyrophosphatase